MKRKIKSFFDHFILSVLGIIWLLPIAWLVIQSLRGEPRAFTSYIIPKQWTLDNYIKLFTETSLFSWKMWANLSR